MWCCFRVELLMTKLRRLFRLHFTFGGGWYFSFISFRQRWHYLECDCEHVLYCLPFCMLNQMCTIVSADFWKDDTRTTIKYTICKYCCLFTDSVVMSLSGKKPPSHCKSEQGRNLSYLSHLSVWAGLPSGKAGRPRGFGLNLLRLSFLFKSCGLWTLSCESLTIIKYKTLKWLSLLPTLMQKSFWWWQCSDKYIISLSLHLHSPFSPSLISLMVSVDIKHHVLLLTLVCENSIHEYSRFT